MRNADICHHPTFLYNKFPQILPPHSSMPPSSLSTLLHFYLFPASLSAPDVSYFYPNAPAFEITIIITIPLLICFQGNMASEQADDLMVLNTYNLTGVLVCMVHVC